MDKSICKDNVGMRKLLEAINEVPYGIAFIENNEEKLCGVVTDGDLKRALQNNHNINKLSIRKIMTKNPISVNEDMLAAKALEIMNSKKITSLCVYGGKIKNRTIGIKKNKIPPHADNPSDKKNPAAINFISEIFPLLNLNPETKRYIAMNANNNPNGSDLNHPINPREKIGTEIEKINAANSPAVVPPRTRTKANTTIAVKEPITNGKSTVKS